MRQSLNAETPSPQRTAEKTLSSNVSRTPALLCLSALNRLSVLQSCNSAHGRQRFGLRWQSAAVTPLFVRTLAPESGVALRFPPQSKNRGCGESRAVFICVHLWLH